MVFTVNSATGRSAASAAVKSLKSAKSIANGSVRSFKRGKTTVANQGVDQDTSPSKNNKRKATSQDGVADDDSSQIGMAEDASVDD